MRKWHVTIRSTAQFAWQHLVTLRGVLNEDGLHGGDLLQVGRLQPFHHVHIRVVSATLVVQHVLDKPGAVDADGIEAEVIRAALVAVGDGGYAQVSQRDDPLGKNGCDGRVALCVYAANLARAVINVEVPRDELLLRLYFEWHPSVE